MRFFGTRSRASPKGGEQPKKAEEETASGTFEGAVADWNQDTVTVAGKDVLSAEVKDDKPALKEAPAVALEAGWQPFVAEFTRLPGAARVEVFWEGKGFRSEPLPPDPLGHLPAAEPARLAADAALDHGRFLVEEHSCVACHHPADKDRLAAGLAVAATAGCANDSAPACSHCRCSPRRPASVGSAP